MSSWRICSDCQGHGKSSAYLGSFTMDEFHHSFDPDEQEAYFAGKYDRTCSTCKGSGKLLVTPELEEERRFQAEWDNEQMWERRMLGERE